MVDNFEAFWEKYRGTFPGYANGEEIEEIANGIAYAAWCKSRDQKTLQEIKGLGLTKREAFAAKALQGLLASTPGLIEAMALGNLEIVQEHAQGAVELADALIQALNES